MEQPMPTPGKEDVTEALIAHIRRRQEKGIRTYGTSLQTFNGRRALEDAIDEALDLAQYLMQERMERKALEEELTRLREALRPFAALASDLQERSYGDGYPLYAVGDAVITYGDVRRAKAVLEKGG